MHGEETGRLCRHEVSERPVRRNRGLSMRQVDGIDPSRPLTNEEAVLTALVPSLPSWKSCDSFYENHVVLSTACSSESYWIDLPCAACLNSAGQQQPMPLFVQVAKSRKKADDQAGSQVPTSFFRLSDRLAVTEERLNRTTAQLQRK
jgi:hypothetical protein